MICGKKQRTEILQSLLSFCIILFIIFFRSEKILDIIHDSVDKIAHCNCLFSVFIQSVLFTALWHKSSNNLQV